MRTIWKYDVEPGVFTVEMPADARVLSVQMQQSELNVRMHQCKAVMWAFLPNDGAPKVQRHFVTYGTGQEIMQAGLVFQGTFQPPGPLPLVFHLFEIPSTARGHRLGDLP
jgi:hypothetical protein